MGLLCRLRSPTLLVLCVALFGFCEVGGISATGHVPGQAHDHRGGWGCPAPEGADGSAAGSYSRRGAPPAAAASAGRGDWGQQPGGGRPQDYPPPQWGQGQPPHPQRQGGPDAPHRHPPSYGGGHAQQGPPSYQQPPPQYAQRQPGSQQQGPPRGSEGPMEHGPPPAREMGPPPPSSSSSGKRSKRAAAEKDEAPVAGADYSNVDKEKVFRALWDFYRKRVLPLEVAYQYDHFEGKSPMTESDFISQPMVLLLGPYSVGKTSFIRSLIKCDFPGQRIGPEPTTDRFMAIMHGKREQLVPGHAAVLQSDKPFTALARAKFGSDFLNRFEVAEVPSPFLKDVMLIDSPGILSGEKQKAGRGYVFEDVVRWFAERADEIIIMFDAHKLDISDELRNVMMAIKEHEDKIRILLNKADSIDIQQLMRVYGALMWQLGKVVGTPEPSRVYISSFWENAIRNTENKALLEREKYDLLKELHNLPANAINRKVNELYKRIRSVRVHCFLVHHFRKKVPRLIGKQAAKNKLADPEEVYREMYSCASKSKYRLAAGDLPDARRLAKRLSEVDIRRYDKLDKSRVVNLAEEFSDYLSVKLEEARTSATPPTSHKGWR